MQFNTCGNTLHYDADFWKQLQKNPDKIATPSIFECMCKLALDNDLMQGSRETLNTSVGFN